MRLLVSADETGGIKDVVFNRGTDTSKKDGQKPKSVAVIEEETKTFTSRSRVVFMKAYKDQYLVSIRLNGELRINELTSQDEEEPFKLLHSYKLAVKQGDKPVSLSCIESQDIIVVALKSKKIFVVFLNDNKFDSEPKLLELEGNKEIEDFASNPNEAGVFAYGGKELDLKIIRLFSVGDKKITKKEFEKKDFLKIEEVVDCKNVPNDHLDMRVPVWISKIKFFDNDDDSEGYRIITATRYGQLRLYDTSKRESPLNDFKINEKPLITLNFANEQQDEILVTDTHKLVAKYTLSKIDPHGFKISSASAGTIIRPTPKLLGKFSEGGNTGATFGVEFAFEEDLVAVGGLDRYLRVFDINTRKIVGKVYVGTQISDILFIDAEDEEEEETEDGERKVQITSKKRKITTADLEESDEEEIWNQLEGNNDTDEKQKKTKKTKKN